jgi:thiaminase
MHQKLPKQQQVSREEIIGTEARVAQYNYHRHLYRQKQLIDHETQ